MTHIQKTETEAGFPILAQTSMELYRARTVLSKEPETIQWINDMLPGSYLYDIGANIGIYSIYAGLRGIKVIAIEPQLENFNSLIMNIWLNKLQHMVFPFYAAICGEKESPFIPFYIPDIEPGSSGGQIYKPKDEHGKDISYQDFRYVPALTLPEILDLIGYPPNYIKIDVDGHERDILEWIDCLCVKECLSLLVECNQDIFPIVSCHSSMEQFGFEPWDKYNSMAGHSRHRRKGTKSEQAENIIYKNKDWETD